MSCYSSTDVDLNISPVWYAVHIPFDDRPNAREKGKEIHGQSSREDEEENSKEKGEKGTIMSGGLYRTYEEIRPLIDGGYTTAYRRCTTLEMGEHFVTHGVLPVSIGNGRTTKHIFIHVTDDRYCLFFDFTWPFGEKKSFIGSVPPEWAGDQASGSGDQASGSGDQASGSGDQASGSGDQASGSGGGNNDRLSVTRDLSSLLALSKCLEIISRRFPSDWDVLVHFEYHYAYNCMTRWISKWKRNGWGGKIRHRVLVQILDHQKKMLPNVFFHYVPNRNMVHGIHGFVKAKEMLMKKPAAAAVGGGTNH